MSPYTKIFPLFFLLSSVFLMQNAFCDNAYLFHVCSSTSDKFTSKSPYETNLNKLLSLLSSKTPVTGFATGSAGQTPDQTYGLALCRSDLSSADCKKCVVNASTEIRDRCEYNKGAVIWYDYCMVKYMDSNFFGQIDEKNKFSLYNVRNISNDPELFNQKVKGLLSKLMNEATSSGPAGKKLYASGEMKLDTFTNLYGLTQCTRDLSVGDCKKCLDDAISELPNCCDGKQGGRVVGGSCNFRYEIYPFLNS